VNGGQPINSQDKKRPMPTGGNSQTNKQLANNWSNKSTAAGKTGGLPLSSAGAKKKSN